MSCSYPLQDGKFPSPGARPSSTGDAKPDFRPKGRTRAMKPNTPLSALCSVAMIGLSAVGAFAQGGVYPSRYVSIIIQTAAGSGPDVIARIVADGLTHSWGQQVAIINRNGGAGLVQGGYQGAGAEH